MQNDILSLSLCLFHSLGGTTKTSSINEAITKTSKRILSTKVVNKAWENIKQKEELHLPSTQLWDFKENCYHSACGCSSNSNTTRYVSCIQQESNKCSIKRQ